MKKKSYTRLFLIMLFFLYCSALLADFFAPYAPDFEDRGYSYAPPMTIHFYDSQKQQWDWPFVYGYRSSLDAYRQKVYRADPDRKYYLQLFSTGETHYLLGLFPTRIHLFGLENSTLAAREASTIPPVYLLGADARGRDIFSRLLYGGRVSLFIGLFGAFLTFFLGTLIGALAGYYGGALDIILMRLCEIIMLIPSIYLLFALRAIIPLNLSSTQIYVFMILILSLIGWAGIARVIRGMVAGIKQREFVLAARALGQSNFKIIFFQIVPHTFSYLIVALSLSVPSYIIGESVLSFLGLGITDPAVSWGLMLSEAAKISELKFHPWVLWPAALIMASVLCYNLLGDALREKFGNRY